MRTRSNAGDYASGTFYLKFLEVSKKGYKTLDIYPANPNCESTSDLPRGFFKLPKGIKFEAGQKARIEYYIPSGGDCMSVNVTRVDFLLD